MAPRINGSSGTSAASATSNQGPLTDGQDIRNRLDLCKMMVDKARAAGIPPELVFMTMGVESSFHQNSGGDRDSVGLFQQRPSCGWGSSAQCYDPAHAVDEFIKHAQSYKGQFGSSPAQLGAWCQKVQGSAFPDRYQSLAAEAQRCVAAVDAGKAPGGKDVAASGNGSNLSTTDGASGGGGGSGGGGSGVGASGGSGGSGAADATGSNDDSTVQTATGAVDVTAPAEDTYTELLKEITAKDMARLHGSLKKAFPQLSAAQVNTLAKTLAAHPGLVTAMQKNPKLATYVMQHPEAVDKLASSDSKVVATVLAAAGVKDSFQTAKDALVDISPATPQGASVPVNASLTPTVSSGRNLPIAV